MAARNPDSVTSSQGEFHASRPRDEPSTTHGHKPGVQTGNDAAPAFHAQTLPPGSAPQSNTFTPNSSSETPGQADNDLSERSHGKESTKTNAADTLGGATSQDVHTGLGHRGQGQTSAELRQGTGKKEAGGTPNPTPNPHAALPIHPSITDQAPSHPPVLDSQIQIQIHIQNKHLTTPIHPSYLQCELHICYKQQSNKAKRAERADGW